MQQTKFEGNYRTGIILIIVGAAITLAMAVVASIMFFFSLANVGIYASFMNSAQTGDFELITTTNPEMALVKKISFIFYMIVLIPNIINLIFASQSIKNKATDKKVLIAVLAIIFGGILGIIGGIMILCAPTSTGQCQPKVEIEIKPNPVEPKSDNKNDEVIKEQSTTEKPKPAQPKTEVKKPTAKKVEKTEKPKQPKAEMEKSTAKKVVKSTNLKPAKESNNNAHILTKDLIEKYAAELKKHEEADKLEREAHEKALAATNEKAEQEKMIKSREEAKAKKAQMSIQERTKIDGSDAISEPRSELQKHASSLREQAKELEIKLKDANLRNMTKKELIVYMKTVVIKINA
ncbi:hypothetical protein [Williamsoniiplasma luminosum]|uniref:Uncharacterized protein n=1 Tax=Williamsoniiplasma luminosum TaxID=214888 RepID=A0A2S0NL66_9MOLU|nr:hypothetical protein [Williamsoniiplasma luminosum]AVP49773.1 MAG: hypothetical protein C5T88_04365 [Williamsoniiplasma luminosum]